MSNDLNSCNFIGRLGKDPETRFTAGGDPICNFSIGCGYAYKTTKGTEWINVSVFGKLAEICQQYLKKGSQVYVSGKMKTDKYEKDGITKYSVKINASTVQFLGKSEGKPDDKPASKDDDFVDDDIPF